LDPLLRAIVEDGMKEEELRAAGFDVDLARRVSALAGQAGREPRRGTPVLQMAARDFGVGRRA
jgi:hypothetical protein